VPGHKAVESKSSLRRIRRVFNPEFKAKVALAALRKYKTLAETVSTIRVAYYTNR
jgi:hypothetical protein